VRDGAVCFVRQIRTYEELHAPTSRLDRDQAEHGRRPTDGVSPIYEQPDTPRIPQMEVCGSLKVQPTIKTPEQAAS
jgi:hypothetical protein